VVIMLNQPVKERVRDIPFARPLIGEAEKRAVLEVLSGTTLVHGPKAEEFEQAFADFTGAPNAVAVGSCTAAMHLVYLYLGLGEGDEVIVPAQTHVSAAHAVELVGAKPVFVDADEKTGNIDVDLLAKAITDRTKVLTVVHFLGRPANMHGVMELAHTGPTDKSRISAPADIDIRKVSAVFEVTPEAEEKWRTA